MTTGDMLKGRSSMDMTKVFPQNSFREIWMAAMMPHTVFMGTANNARSNVIFTYIASWKFEKALRPRDWRSLYLVTLQGVMPGL